MRDDEIAKYGRELTDEERAILSQREAKLNQLSQYKESHRRHQYGKRYRKNAPYRRWDDPEGRAR